MLTSAINSQFRPNFTSKSVPPSINPNKQCGSNCSSKPFLDSDTFSSSSGLDPEGRTALAIAKTRASKASEDVNVAVDALNMLRKSYLGCCTEYARVAINAAMARVMQELQAREDDAKAIVEQLEEAQAVDSPNTTIESRDPLNPIGPESNGLKSDENAHVDSESEETDMTPDEYEDIIAKKLIESGNTMFTQEDIDKILKELKLCT